MDARLRWAGVHNNNTYVIPSKVSFVTEELKLVNRRTSKAKITIVSRGRRLLVPSYTYAERNLKCIELVYELHWINNALLQCSGIGSIATCSDPSPTVHKQTNSASKYT